MIYHPARCISHIYSRNYIYNLLHQQPHISPDIPLSPSDLTIHTDTFTSSSVSISWNESDSSCVTGYNVSSVLLQSITTSDTTVTVEGLVPSNNQYCIVVTTIDTANRSSSDSDPVCFVFNSESV